MALSIPKYNILWIILIDKNQHLQIAFCLTFAAKNVILKRIGGDEMTFEKTMNEENEQRVEITMLVRYMLERWRVLLLSGVICALLGVIFAAVTYVPYYTSKISYVINSAGSTSVSTSMTTNEFMVAEYMANTYSYIIKSRDLVQRVQAETGLEEDLTQYISAQLVESSNIMEVKIRTDDAQKSYAIASAVNEYLPELSKMAVRTGSLDVLENPQLALEPDANNKLKMMGLIGALVGILLAAAFYIVLYFIRRTVRTPDTLTERIDIKHLGSVPHVDINLKKNIITGQVKATDKKEPMLITNKKTGFVFNETYKSVRTKVERFAKKHGSKAIIVSSALENEGKTTVAVNIALTLAQNGNRVILADCDLRKPAVATVLGEKDKVKVPMIDVIEKRATLDSAIVKLENPRLDFIGGLKSVDNSSEVLSTKGLSDALNSLREKYDYIILDTPPSQLFTDAVIMTEEADASILVVRQDSASIDDVINIAFDFSQSKAELIGFVFNNVIASSILPSGYSKKYNYSYYGYGKK